jgi:hypothetical protein
MREKKMKTKEDLEKEYEEKLKKLRETCKHPKVTEVNDRCAATGQWIDFFIKKCDVCGAVLSRQTLCADCHKEIHDDEIKHIFGFEICPDCYKERDTFYERLYARTKRMKNEE